MSEHFITQRLQCNLEANPGVTKPLDLSIDFLSI